MFVRMFSAFQSKQSLYIAMEFVQGGDCLTMLTSRARLVEMVKRTLRALLTLRPPLCSFYLPVILRLHLFSLADP
jgi:serine/threonine protein kinase